MYLPIGLSVGLVVVMLALWLFGLFPGTALNGVFKMEGPVFLQNLLEGEEDKFTKLCRESKEKHPQWKKPSITWFMTSDYKIDRMKTNCDALREFAIHWTCSLRSPSDSPDPAGFSSLVTGHLNRAYPGYEKWDTWDDDIAEWRECAREGVQTVESVRPEREDKRS